MIIRTFEKFIRCSEGKQFKSAMAWKHVVLLNGIFLMLVEFVGNRLSVRLSVCLSVLSTQGMLMMAGRSRRLALGSGGPCTPQAILFIGFVFYV